MPRIARLLSLICITTGLTCSAFAADPPDAGSLLNQQRQPGSALPSRLPKADEAVVERAPLSDNGLRITVKTVRFTGIENVASESELQELVRNSIGKQLSFAELQELAAQVTTYLRERKGYMLARAYLPKQDVTSGTIEIAILAGQLERGVKINIKKPARIRQSVLEGVATAAMDKNGPVKSAQVERATLLMNDLPGVNARAYLEPGSSTGSTRVVIDATEGNLFGALLSLDNYGDNNTGAFRATGQLSAFDPSGYGDLFTLSVIGAENSLQGRVGYTLPLGFYGTTASLSYTGSQYKLGNEFASLDLSGNSSTFGVNVTHPLLRSRTASVWASIGFEYLLLNDKSGGTTYRERKLPVGNGTLNANFFDGWLGGGMSNASLALYSGTLDIRNSDPTVINTGGSFFRSTYAVSRLQRITQQTTLFTSLRGQFAASNLDSSQKFNLGGPTAVRAYPVGEGSGDTGHILTAELRYELPFMPKWLATQLLGFVDTGWIRLHQSGGTVNTATGQNSYQLSGVGTGLNIFGNSIYSMQAIYAHTLGDNPGRTVSGNNADNKDTSSRFWLQATIRF